LRCDEFEFDVATRGAWRDGEPVVLTDREWTLLEALARGGGQVLSRAALLALMAQTGVVTSDNALNIHFCNLRRKVGREVIQTIRGRGYRLVAPLAADGALVTA
jgi:two-component system OmpR family response regulator